MGDTVLPGTDKGEISAGGETRGAERVVVGRLAPVSRTVALGCGSGNRLIVSGVLIHVRDVERGSRR
jgi:hypothetical protein